MKKKTARRKWWGSLCKAKAIVPCRNEFSGPKVHDVPWQERYQ